MVDEVVLGQVFSKYFGFPCPSSSHQLLSTVIIIYHLGLVVVVPAVPSGLSLTLLRIITN
jgi:hypothetical protein